jgi:hypothetical protein
LESATNSVVFRNGRVSIKICINNTFTDLHGHAKVLTDLTKIDMISSVVHNPD